MAVHSAVRRPGFYGQHPVDTATPVLVLGGKENSLSLVRSLGRLGVEVSVAGRRDCWGLRSKYCRRAFPIARSKQLSDGWRDLLLGGNAEISTRHVLLACCDEALEFLATHDEALRQRHLFDGSPPEQRRAFLDKCTTLETARQVGVGYPAFRVVETGADYMAQLADCRFPVIVKPHKTFRFARVFGRKFFKIETGAAELEAKIKQAHAAGFDVMVCEMIPGSDGQLSSYYTYVDEDGNELFSFTKRCVRRYPINQGLGSCQVTAWLPETAELGRRFFRETGLRGFGNVEFKRDPRDGKLKIIEVNARFTAVQELLVKAGAPVDVIVYCALTGQTPPTFTSYQQDLCYWNPLRDFLAYWQLQRQGETSFVEWIGSLSGKRLVTPSLDLSDIRPTLGIAGGMVGRLLAAK